MATKKTTPFNIEKSLEKLEQLIEKMEKGDISLEQSLSYYEEGIKITRECQKALQTAEQKVQLLSQQGSKHQLVDFDADEE